MPEEPSREVTIVERGNPVVLALLTEHTAITVAVVLALASYASIEVVNLELGDPLGGYERWAADPHNGNHRLRGAWFFALAGLWLHPASLVVAFLAGRRAARSARHVPRIGWLAIGLAMVALFVRLLDLGLVSATLGLEN